MHIRQIRSKCRSEIGNCLVWAIDRGKKGEKVRSRRLDRTSGHEGATVLGHALYIDYLNDFGDDFCFTPGFVILTNEIKKFFTKRVQV